jgi:hypothetical protein
MGFHVSCDSLMFVIGFCQGGANGKQGKHKQVKMAVRTNNMTVSDTRFIYVYSVQTARWPVNSVTKRVHASTASNTDCLIHVRMVFEKKERKG